MTWISYINDVAGATITATREVSSLPVDKIRSAPVAERWRAADLSPGDTATTVTFGWPTPARPEVVFWMRPRRRAAIETAAGVTFAPTDTVRHRLHDDADPAAGHVYDSGAAPSACVAGYGVHALILPDGDAAGYASATFDAVSRDTPPNNFMEWGYAHYGRIDLEPSIDYASPAVFGRSEGAVRRFSADGSALRVRRKATRQRWRLVFRSIRWATEAAAVEAFLEHVGDGGRFVMGLDRTDMSRGVVLAMLDAAAYQRTSRRFGQLELPIIEAF